MKKSIRRIIINFLLYCLILYAGLLGYAYFFADQHIFFPPTPSYRDDSSIIKIPSRQGALISAIYLPNAAAKYTVLVSHGNAEDLGRILPFLRKFHDQGYAVFAYDYQGYGTSQGRASEANSYADELAAYTYLIQKLKIPPQQIIAYGRSLGAALAIDLAARKPLAGLIVESGFASAFRLSFLFPLLPFDKYNNLEKIKKITCPLLLIHGTSDEVIPFSQGIQLYQSTLVPKLFFPIPGGRHNNLLLTAGAQYWQVIRKFTELLERN